MDFNSLLIDLQKTYYTQLIMFCVEFLALIIGIANIRVDKSIKYFLFYIAFDLTILVVNWILELLYTPHVKTFVFINISNTLISFVELFVYFRFFQKVLFGKGILIWLKISFQFYLTIILVHLIFVIWSSNNNHQYISYSIGALEFLLLLPPCFKYYSQILNFTPEISLQERPSFWIITGIFFYSIISVPYYLLTTYISVINHEYKNLYEAAFYYIPFTINFIFLIKAFTCKKSLTI